MKSQKSNEEAPTGKLYLVPTPIGNLNDMTFRAIDILKNVDYIAAEDTRHTQNLLNHFDIKVKQISFHEHNKIERIPDLINHLLAGEDLAQVSDAGMPSISDPGYELVEAAINNDIPVIPLPGANAGLTALIASGINPQPFYFYGFLPSKKKDRRSEIEKLNKIEATMILYEAPHRLKNVIPDLAKELGGERRIVLARELTKRYEEIIRGTLFEAEKWVNDSEIRGEFCLIIEGNTQIENEETDMYGDIGLKEHVMIMMEAEDLSSKQAIKKVSTLRDLPKREVYAAYHEL